jgi:hypothetical protein
MTSDGVELAGDAAELDTLGFGDGWRSRGRP